MNNFIWPDMMLIASYISPRLREFEFAYLIISTIKDVKEDIFAFNSPIII
jgi:hypothetical protein